jgi:hypothetical protein
MKSLWAPVPKKIPKKITAYQTVGGDFLSVLLCDCVRFTQFQFLLLSQLLSLFRLQLAVLAA